MALLLHYVNDEQAYVAQQEFVHCVHWAQARSTHYRTVFSWAVLIALAIYAAYEAELVALVVVFAICLAVYLRDSLPYARLHKRALAEAARNYPAKEVRLVVDEEGLHETVEEIESFAPWSSIRSFAIHRDVLLVELRAALWAIIPRHALRAGSAPVDALVDELRKRGIAEHSARKPA